MRRFLALTLGIAVGLALARALRRRRAPATGPGPGDPRAAELARKLADTRAAGASAPAAGDESEPDAHRPPDDVEIDEARRRVHEQARATAEEMRRSGGAEKEGRDL